MEKKVYKSTYTLGEEMGDGKTYLPTIPEVETPLQNIDQTTTLECRICLQAKDEERSQLISPCNCTGSVKYIHGSCFKSWIVKKYQDPTIRQQVASKAGVHCQICKQPYDFNFSVKRECGTFTSFCLKARHNKLFLSGNLIFIIIDIILLSIACNCARQDIQDGEFDIKQPRFFLTLIALFSAAVSLVYGFYEFFNFFVMREMLIVSPLIKEQIEISLDKTRSFEIKPSQMVDEQESNLMIAESNPTIVDIFQMMVG